MEKLLFILFGWLLGLLAPAISERIKRRYQREEIRAAIEVELYEIRYRLAGSVYVINQRHGTIDKDVLRWILPIFKGYKGAYASPRLLKVLDSHLNLSDEQLYAIGEHFKSDGTHALTFRHFSTPFLDTHIGSLRLFSPKFQVALLEIKTQISILNEQVEEAKDYKEKTFALNLSDENYDSVKNDLERTYRQICDRSRSIVDGISMLKEFPG